MINVLIIGAGQLGGRHLQGLITSSLVDNIHVMDPSEESLRLAKARAKESTKGNDQLEIIYHTTLTELPEKFDFVVIATNSNVRYTVLKELLQQCSVRYLLLEKVLFTSLDEYALTEHLLDKYNVTAYVNCARRAFNFYKELKSSLSASEHIHLTYVGNDWGLACNGIHFIDLASYLSQNTCWHINTDMIMKVKPSKRAGYYEVDGTLFARGHDNSTITLTSDSNKLNNGMLSIVGESFSAIIDETNASAAICRDNEWKIIPFNIQYQSQLTSPIFEELLQNGSCGLTSFSESKKIHKPFISEMTKVFSRYGIDGCPIT